MTFNTLKIRHRALPALILACAAAWSAGAFADDEPPALRLDLFSAIYEANVDFITGTVRMSVQRAASGDLYFEYSVQAQKFWDYFIRGDLEETTTFEMHKGRPRPKKYQLFNTISSNPRSGSYNFDWEAKEVIGIYKDRSVRLPLTPDTIDRAMLPLALMRDLRNDDLRDEYHVLDRDEIMSLALKREGEEMISLPYGSVKTIVVKHVSKDGADESRLWFAPGLDFLLVKMEQFENKEPVFSAELRQLMIYF